MSNVEILGRPLYLPVKVRLQEDKKPLDQLKSKESKLPLTYTDLVYEREENDSSCDDV
jgi:hypothetical protein